MLPQTLKMTHFFIWLKQPKIWFLAKKLIFTIHTKKKVSPILCTMLYWSHMPMLKEKWGKKFVQCGSKNGNFGQKNKNLIFFLHLFPHLMMVLKQYDSQPLFFLNVVPVFWILFLSKTVKTSFCQKITFYIEIWAKKAFWYPISSYSKGTRWKN